MNVKIFLIGLLIFISSTLSGQSSKQAFYKAIIAGNTLSQYKIADDLKGSYSKFTYSYYKLLLNSLPKKAILITNSLDDTYPIKILQLNQGIRSDISVVSIKMLKDSVYINTVNNLYGLSVKNESSDSQVNSIFNSHNNCFFSATVKSSYWHNTSYFISGLYLQKGSQNSQKKLSTFYDDFSRLKLKSYQFTSRDKSLLKNILPPLIMLYKNGERSDTLKKDILMVADIVGNRKAVTTILDAD